MKRQLVASAALLIALTACGGQSPTPEQTPSQSTGETATAPATPSPTKSPTSKPTKTATEERTAVPETPGTAEQTGASEAAQAEAPAQIPPQAAAGTVEQFFQTGGRCISDVWSSSMDYTEALHQQVTDYCAANKLGDWSHGYDPMDPSNYGGGQTTNTARANEAEEIGQCEAADPKTSSSGTIQYCYMEYGISVGEPAPLADVAGTTGP